MVRINADIYRQDYYSQCFFTLTEVMDDERVRLMRLDINVLDYDISIGEREGILLFYLHLYFTPSPYREITYEELFGNTN